MDFFDIDSLHYDVEETMDKPFADEYRDNHLKLTYLTPEHLVADERLNRLADLILAEGIHNEATDIQILRLSVDVAVVRLRIGSEMRAHRKIEGLAAEPLSMVFKRRSQADITNTARADGGRLNYSLAGETHNLRSSFMPAVRGTNVSVRVLYASTLVSDVTKLGFPDYVAESVVRVLQLQEGLILLTGATGSGKTTTMYTAINHIMAENGGMKNILTIENPVEYIIEGIVQSEVNHEFGYTFPVGLKTALRQNPDVILVGEINDQETAETAVRASTSGHLVFSTMHSNNVLSTGQAMEHYKVSNYQLSWALQLVLNQSLPRRLCPNCRRTRMVGVEESKWLGTLREGVEVLHVHEAVGCEECENYGYKGRVLVVEMLDANKEYTRLAMQGLTLVELEDELLKNENARYYPKRYDVLRHLQAGDIDYETAKQLLR